MEPDIRRHHLTIPRQARYATLGNPGTHAQVWFGLHGYGQLAHRFLRYLAPLDDGSRLLVAPEGLHRYYVDHDAREVGASWMTSEDRLTDIEDYVDWLDRLYGHVVGPGAGEDPAVFALGFSQGVHTLCRWLALGDAEVDVGVLWGAGIPPDLDLSAHGDRLRRIRLFLVTGEEDEHFGPDALAATEARLEEHGVLVETATFPGGHRLDRDVLERLAARAG